MAHHVIAVNFDCGSCSEGGESACTPVFTYEWGVFGLDFGGIAIFSDFFATTIIRDSTSPTDSVTVIRVDPGDVLVRVIARDLKCGTSPCLSTTSDVVFDDHFIFD